jgi:uncharacterized Tic20 family protein
MSDNTTSPYAGFTPLTPSDEKLWATLVQLGGALFGIIVPLIGFLVLRARGPFIREHTTAALNWQITLVIAYFVGTVTSVLFIGILILIAAGVLQIVFGIIASLRAYSGQLYTYPLSIKFIQS